MPDIEVLQDVPDELKARTDTKGEASLRGHLKNDGDEKTGSQSYVPPDAKDDKALKMADDLLHGIKVNRQHAPRRRPATRPRSTSRPTRPRTDRTRQTRFFEKGGPRAALFACGPLPRPAGTALDRGLPRADRPRRGIVGRLIRGDSMAETADDLSAPLGQTDGARKRRFRLPFTGMQALAVLLGLFLVAFAGFAIFNDNPLGGEPIAPRRAASGRRPPDEKPAAAAAGACRALPPKSAAKQAAAGEHKTVTIIDGSSGTRQDVVIGGGDAADKAGARAPRPRTMAGIDPRLLEKSRYGMIPVVADGLKPSPSMPPTPTAPRPQGCRWSPSSSAASASAPPRPPMPS